MRTVEHGFAVLRWGDRILRYISNKNENRSVEPHDILCQSHTFAP